MAEIENTQEEESLDIRALLNQCLANWKWFIISVIICVGVGAIYLLKTPKQFERSATLLIKDDKGGKGTSGMAAMAASMGFSTGGSSGMNVNNELAILQAPSYIMETGKQLGLDMNYSVRNILRHDALYGKTLPINIRFLSLRENETASLNINLNADGTYTINKFRRYGTKDRKLKDKSTEVKGRLNQVVNTPIGKVLVTPTAYFATFIDKVDKPISVSNTLLYDMTQAILKNLTAELDSKQATIINITYKDPIPDRAVDIINTLVSVYKERQLKDKNAVIDATINFIDKRTVDIERSLNGYETKMADYQAKHFITDDGTMPSLVMGQAQSSTTEIVQLQAQRVLATYIRSMILKDVHQEQVLPNTGLGNDGIDEQIGNYNSLIMQRSTLIANSSANNPLVKDLSRQITDMKGIMVKSLNNYVVGIDKRMGLAQENQDKSKAKLSEMPGEALYLRTIGRNRSLAEQMYIYLLQKRADTEMDRFNIDKAQLVSPPLGSEKPVSPKGKVVLLIAFILGLAIPVGVIFVLQSTNNKIRRRKDLEGINLPVLGEIPFVGKHVTKLPWKKKEIEQPLQILVSDGRSNNINEAFRVLRTKFETIVPKGTSSNVTLFTSPDNKSGKSFITVNLAKSFAIKGNKVLVIDSDFRKASASQLVGSPQKGLVDYLSGKETSAERLAYKYEGSNNLSILPTGIIPDNPTELLDNGRFQELINSVRTQYDYVFIDAPTIEIYADTEIIAPYADRTMFILRAGQFELAKLPILQKISNESTLPALQNSNIENNTYKNLTLILNGTEE